MFMNLLSILAKLILATSETINMEANHNTLSFRTYLSEMKGSLPWSSLKLTPSWHRSDTHKGLKAIWPGSYQVASAQVGSLVQIYRISRGWTIYMGFIGRHTVQTRLWLGKHLSTTASWNTTLEPYSNGRHFRNDKWYFKVEMEKPSCSFTCSLTK